MKISTFSSRGLYLLRNFSDDYFIGLVSLLDLSVREYPKIDEPVVSVRTDYKGAAPEIIESQITKPLKTLSRELRV